MLRELPTLIGDIALSVENFVLSEGDALEERQSPPYEIPVPLRVLAAEGRGALNTVRLSEEVQLFNDMAVSVAHHFTFESGRKWVDDLALLRSVSLVLEILLDVDMQPLSQAQRDLVESGEFLHHSYSVLPLQFHWINGREHGGEVAHDVRVEADAKYHPEKREAHLRSSASREVTEADCGDCLNRPVVTHEILKSHAAGFEPSSRHPRLRPEIVELGEQEPQASHKVREEEHKPSHLNDAPDRVIQPDALLLALEFHELHILQQTQKAHYSEDSEIELGTCVSMAPSLRKLNRLPGHACENVHPEPALQVRAADLLNALDGLAWRWHRVAREERKHHVCQEHEVDSHVKDHPLDAYSVLKRNLEWNQDCRVEQQEPDD